MATALDIAQDALRRIGALASGETVNADEAVDAIAILSRMLSAWEMDGVRLGPLTDRTLETTTVIPLPAPQIEAVTVNLAVRLAPSYGRDVHPVLASLADRGLRAMQAAYQKVPVVRQDEAIARGDGSGYVSLADIESGRI